MCPPCSGLKLMHSSVLDWSFEHSNPQNATAYELLLIAQGGHISFLASSDKAYLVSPAIDLLAILQKSLDRALSLYIFIREVRLNGVRVSITIVRIRKFYKM